jgi:purine-nucleoside phosphorylase
VALLWLKANEDKDIPGFAVSTVVGHAGALVFAKMNGVPVVFMLGRYHFYEGYFHTKFANISFRHSLQKATYPVRIMKLLGCHTVVVTNAAGGLNPAYTPGDVMVIKDHLNWIGLSGAHPLVGLNDSSFGTRFPATSDAYDPELRKAFFRAAKTIPGLNTQEGVYVILSGPTYESRTEARAMRTLGVDAVGMSTVPETVIARHAGMRVLGLSLITNAVSIEPIAGVKDEVDKEDPSKPPPPPKGKEEVTNHEEVLDTANKVGPLLVQAVKKAIGMFPPPVAN